MIVVQPLASLLRQLYDSLFTTPSSSSEMSSLDENQDPTPAVGIQASEVLMHSQKSRESTVDGSHLKLFHRVVSDLQSSRQRERPYMQSIYQGSP
jgi:hypothetical protein